MEKVYARTKGIRDDMVVGFCPGCMHGTVFKLIGEVLEELGVLEKTITVHGVGCCGLAMEYVTYDCTTTQSYRGRCSSYSSEHRLWVMPSSAS